jgi:hypothetical protein
MNSCVLYENSAIESSLYSLNPLLLDWLGAVESLLPPPVNSYQIADWIGKAEEVADEDFRFLPEEWVIIQKILDIFENFWKRRFDLNGHGDVVNTVQSADISEIIHNLSQRTNTQQRTAEWYEEYRNLLTASEIGDLFESAATFRALVRSKVLPRDKQANSLAVPSDSMTAFDWGIRFEPVVKQIYKYLYGAEIEELGRIQHPVDSRLAASPDGIIKSADQEFANFIGNLIEIKCPVTRKPDGRISNKYYHQMQLQMEVTGLMVCQFAEFTFLSKYKEDWEGSAREDQWVQAVRGGGGGGGGALHGYIFLVERQENSVCESGEITPPIQRISHRYEYGPVNDLSWVPRLDEEREHIIETIPWALVEKKQQFVAKDPAWWDLARPKVEEFWQAVEKGRKEHAEGNFAAAVKSPRKRVDDGGQQQICVIRLDRSNQEKNGE